MTAKELFAKFHEVVADPSAQKQKYLSEGKKVILMAPVYTPEEIVHSMGFAPMAAWGADLELNESKKYFPAFICSIVQSILELGMRGVYEGVSAIVIPSLCDSLKTLGENWKYAVPSIPFIPMTYPQNRKPSYGKDYTKEGYKRVIADLEKATGVEFDESKLSESIRVYNEHNAVMREFAGCIAAHPEVTARQRSDVFKSAGFMMKEEHTRLVKELMEALEKEGAVGGNKIKIMTSGIIADSPSLLEALDENSFQIVADDIAAESRQYRTDAPTGGSALDDLAQKYCDMDNCSVLFDREKNRVNLIADQCKQYGAEGVLVILTKFCDPEEFDYPLIKKKCEQENIPVMLVEIDRQMKNYEQARTILESFKELCMTKGGH